MMADKTSPDKNDRPRLSREEAADVDALTSKLKSATDPTVIRGIIASLSGMSAAANSAAGRKIAEALAAAEKRLQEAIEDEKVEKGYYPSRSYPLDLARDTALTKAVYQHFTEEEQRYFSSINPNQNYTLLSVDANGNLVEGAKREVSGAQLREDFSRLKYHTLPPEKQAEIRGHEAREKGLSEEQIEAAQKPPTLEQAKKEAQQIKESMDNLQDHEAQKTVEKHRGATPEAKKEIKERHEHFKKAHQISDEIIERAEQVGKKEEQVRQLEEFAKVPLPMMPNLAALALPVAQENLEKEKKAASEDIREKKEELRKTIQEDVINNGLGVKPDEMSAEKDRKNPKQDNISISAPTSVSAGDMPTPGSALPAIQTSNSRAIN